MRGTILLSTFCGLLLPITLLAGCSFSDPPSCSDSDVQSKAWTLLADRLFRPETVIGHSTERDAVPITVAAKDLAAAMDWSMSSVRTAGIDATTHKRWCQADLSLTYDASKVDESAIKWSPTDSTHQIDFMDRTLSLEEALKIVFDNVRAPQVIEYAVQRTDDGEIYVTLESSPE